MRFRLLPLLILYCLLPEQSSAQQIITLTDPQNYAWDIQGDQYGSLKDGSSDAYDEWPRLCVIPNNTSVSTGCAVSDIYDAAGTAATLDATGRIVTTAPVTLQGLTVQRKMFVPDSSTSSVGFLRYLEVFTNSTTASKTIKVRVGAPGVNAGSLGSDTSTTLIANSAGTTSTTPGLLWMVTDDTQNDPSVGHIMAGSGATNPMTYVALGNYGNNKDGVLWEYANVTIPAGQTKYLMHFQVQRTLSADSVTAAGALVGLPGYTTTGLTTGERAGILNWVLPPVAEANGPYTGNEGQAISVSSAGSFAITGSLTTYAWDCNNDGTFEYTGATGSATCTYTKYGTYTALLKVTDSAGRTGTDTASVTVANVAPTAGTPQVSGNGLEGSNQTFSVSATDPGTTDTLSYLWTFSDNTTATGASVQKAFADNGSFTYSVKVSDTGGGSDTKTGSATILNANPSITAVSLPSSANEGQTVSGSVTATDPGTADTQTFVWKWSDNVTSNGQNITRTFTQNGTFTVTVTDTDDDGGVATSNASIVINNLPPVLGSVTCTPTAAQGATVTCSAAASDPGADTLTYTWDFGDSSTGTGQAVSHVYTAEGTFTVTVTVTDQDGAFVKGTATVIISNGAPSTPVITVSQPRQEGTPITFSASATDPGGDPLTYTWTFGDAGTGTGASLTHTYTDQGTYNVSVTASDPGGSKSTATTSVTVTNVAPTIVSLSGDFSGNQGQTLSYSTVATDPGSDILTYTWDFGDGTATQKGTDKTSVTHVYSSIGVYTLTLTVEDEDGGKVSQTRTVNIGNGAPSISSFTGDTSGDEGSTFRYSVTASDPGGDTVTYAWNFGDGTTLAASTTNNNVAHVYKDNGTFNVVVTVADPGGLSTTSTQTVVVRNVAPTLTSLTGPSSLLQATNGTFAAASTDPGADTITYAWNWGDNTTGTGATVVHGWCKVGNLTITLTVSDDDGGTVTGTLPITIINSPPTLKSVNGPTSLDEAISGSYSATTNEPCGQTLLYDWNFGDGTTSSSAAPSHAWADNGSFTVNLTVKDRDGGSASGTLAVTVKNVAPAISSTTIPTGLKQGEVGSFKVAASDVPADVLSYNWDFGDGATATSANATHAYARSGSFTVTVTVTDDDGGISTRSGTVVVSNVAPQVTQLTVDAEGDEGSPIEARFSASDASGQIPSALIDWGDGTIEPVLADTTLTHTYEDNDTYLVELTVDDGEATSTASQEVLIHNLNPEIDAINVPSVGKEGEAVTVSVVATDPAGAADPLTYAFDFGDGATQAASASATATHTYNASGSFTITVVVADDDGGSSSRSVSININTAAPIISKFDGDTSGFEGDELTFAVEAYDPTGQTLSYHWTFGEGIPDVTGSDKQVVTQIFPENGLYTVTVEVSDSEGLTASASLEVVVSNLAPVITSVPPTTAVAETELVYTVTATDAGGDNDPLTFTLLSGPTTATLDASGVLRWTPSLADAEAGSAAFDIQVSDDENATSHQAFTVDLGVVDTDQDGMPDSWESGYGLDPQDPSDAGEDPDGDGSTNLEEYENGTDPTTSDSPYAPVPISPIGGEEVTTLTPELIVQDAEIPNGTVLEHEFEVYADAQLQSLVAAGSSSESIEGQTHFFVASGLTENSRFFWRARAIGSFGTGAWCDAVDFYVNVQNDPPTAPGISSPLDGAVVASETVTLEVTNASDPDRDVLTYTFELYKGDATEPVAQSLSLIEGTGGVTRWNASVTLEENETYRWHAMATDEEGLTSTWSEWATFTVSKANQAPSAIQITSPEEGDEVSQSLTVEASASSDPDGDALVYVLQIDTLNTFDSSDVYEDTFVPNLPEETPSWDVVGLAENTLYYARALADDGLTPSAWSPVVSFFVNERNDAPGAPTLQNPSANMVLEPGRQEFSVVNAVDPDRDALTYTFTVTNSAGQTVVEQGDVAEGASGTTSNLLDLTSLPTGQYTWTVYATDDSGLDGEPAAANAFTLEEQTVESPTPTGDDGDGCSCDTREGSRPTTGWFSLAVAGLLFFWRRRR